MTQKMVTFTVQVSDQEALALAQFVKRLGWSEIRQNAVDDAEAHEMVSAIAAVRLGLAEADYAPR